MIERVSYIADDGTAFEDEDECIDYERGLMLKKYEHDIHMWNCEFQPIPITDSQALDKVYYLTCDTAEAVEAMHNWFEYMGYSSPFEGDESFVAMAGCQYYYMDNDKWYEADDLIEKARGMMKIFGV
jgi:hypothetical protein